MLLCQRQKYVLHLLTSLKYLKMMIRILTSCLSGRCSIIILPYVISTFVGQLWHRRFQLSLSAHSSILFTILQSPSFLSSSVLTWSVHHAHSLPVDLLPLVTYNNLFGTDSGVLHLLLYCFHGYFYLQQWYRHLLMIKSLTSFCVFSMQYVKQNQSYAVSFIYKDVQRQAVTEHFCCVLRTTCATK